MLPPEIDTDWIDEAVLALMFLTLHKERASDPLWRAWKAFDWDTMGRLYDKDCIFNPVGKAKSVTLTAEGERRCRQAYYRLFTKEDNQTVPGS